MPIISADTFKYFQPEQSVPNIQGRLIVPGTPSIPTGPSTAGASMVLKVGESLERMGEVIEEARVKDDTMRYTLGAMEDVSKAEQEVSQTGSHRDMPQRFQAQLKDIRVSWEDRIGPDQKVRDAWNQKFGLLAQQHSERVRVNSWKRELDMQQAYAIEAGDSSMKMMGSASSPTEAQMYHDDFINSLDNKARNGLLDASWTAAYKVAWEQRLDMQQWRRTIQVDPDTAYKQLQNPIKDLGEDARQVLLREANAAVKARNIEDNAARETNVYNSLYDQYGGNPDMMLEALHDPKEMKEYGITIANVKSIEAAIHGLDRQKKTDEQKAEMGYFKKMMQGGLTDYDIAKDVEAGTIDPKTGEHWLKVIRDQAKEIKPETQADEIVKINGMISKEEDPDKIRTYVVRSTKLTKEDKEQYINKLEAKLGGEIKDGMRLGYQDIESIVTPKRGQLAALIQTPSEAIATKKAQMALDDWVTGQQKDGKTLTINDIRRKAMNLAQDYQVPMATKMEEMEREAKKMAEETKGYAEKKAADKKKGKEPPVFRGRIE